MRKLNKTWVLGRTFYSLIAVESFIDCVNYGLLAVWFPTDVNPENVAQRAQLLLFITPDVLYQFPYLILFWVLVKSSIEGWINLASDFYIPGIHQKKLGNLILFLLLTIYFASQAVFVGLYLWSII